MYKKIIGLIFLSFAFLLTQTASANSSCGEGLRHMIESLNLSADQKTKISPLLDQLKTTIKNSASQMKDLDMQMNQQMMSGTTDQSSVNGLIDQKTKLIGDIMKAKAAAKSQIMPILTEQQKAQLQEKMKTIELKMVEKYKNCHDDD